MYLLWQPIGSLVALVAARFTGDELTAVRMLGSLALTPLRPRFELWFLWSLVLFFVLARALVRVPLPVQLVVAGAGSAIWFSTLIPETNLGWDGSVKYFVFFLIGAHGRVLLTGFAERIGFGTSLLLIGGWLLISTAAYTSGVDRFVGVGLVVRLIGVAAGIALAVRWQSIGLLSYLGSRTLPIYLAHTPLIICFTWALSTFLGAGLPPAVVVGLLPLMFVVAAVPLSLLLHAALAGHPIGGLLYRPPVVAVSVVRRLFTPRRHATPAVVPLAALVPEVALVPEAVGVPAAARVPEAPRVIDLRALEQAPAEPG